MKSLFDYLIKRHFSGQGSELFDFGVGPDHKDPDVNIIHAEQSGLGLPERDYYLKTGELA